jgi:nucleotide-binding universal stress UspA family protein
MILVCYDGSIDAQAAIEHAGRSMPGAQVTVLTIWEPFLEAMTRNGALGMGFAMYGGYGADAQKIDQASEQTAGETAAEGATRAAALGLHAESQVADRRGAIADTILAAADAMEADVVVVGTRGRSDVKSLLLGSVSHHLLQHADRAVMVVPSPALAEHRRDHLSHLHAETDSA